MNMDFTFTLIFQWFWSIMRDWILTTDHALREWNKWADYFVHLLYATIMLWNIPNLGV